MKKLFGFIKRWWIKRSYKVIKKYDEPNLWDTIINYYIKFKFQNIKYKIQSKGKLIWFDEKHKVYYAIPKNYKENYHLIIYKYSENAFLKLVGNRKYLKSKFTRSDISEINFIIRDIDYALEHNNLLIIQREYIEGSEHQKEKLYTIDYKKLQSSLLEKFHKLHLIAQKWVIQGSYSYLNVLKRLLYFRLVEEKEKEYLELVLKTMSEFINDLNTLKGKINMSYKDMDGFVELKHNENIIESGAWKSLKGLYDEVKSN